MKQVFNRIITLMSFYIILSGVPINSADLGVDKDSRTPMLSVTQSQGYDAVSGTSSVQYSSPPYRPLTIMPDDQATASEGRGEILEWMRAHIFGGPQRSKCAQWTLFTVEAYSGMGRGAVFFKLGYNFGERIFSVVSTPGREILAAVYGTGVFIPMAVLGTRLTSNLLNGIITRKSDIERAIELEQSQPCKIGGYALKVPIVAAGIMSAPPLTYLTYDQLHSWISWGWIVPAVPTFYTRTIIDYYAITTIGGMVYNTIKAPINRRIAASNPNGRVDLMLKVGEQLDHSHSFITSLNYPQAETLVRTIGEQPNTLSKFALLLHPESFITDGVKIQKHSLARKIIGIIGGGVGNCGIWICYPVAVDSFVPVLSILGIAETHALLTTLAVVSTATVSSLPTLAAWSSTHKFYDAITGFCSSAYNSIKARWNGVAQPSIHSMDRKLWWKRFGVGIASTVLAALNAAVQTEIVLEFLDINDVWPKFGLAAAATASFTTSFWAIDELLLSYLKAGDPRTSLLFKIDKIKQKLPYMSETHLRSLAELSHIE